MPPLRILGATLCALLLTTGTARAAEQFAPIDRPGPAPVASESDLKASLTCSQSLDDASVAPVLLVPATTVNSRENYGWNYVPYFKSLGIPTCTTDLPGALAQNMGDIQRRGDYIAYAIRQMHARAHRRIAILGHSQGGMVMRWALRFWPDTREMVDDVIGIAATNHGSAVVPALCVPDCAPALWQQRTSAHFYEALNSVQETFAGISYTEIYTHTDEFVQPDLDDDGTSSLHTGPGRITNVAVQEICPTGNPEHLTVGTTDPVAAALSTDALANDGPADPARIDRGVCAETFMPGVDPTTGPVSLADAGARVASQLAGAPHSPAEPELACYTTPAGCPGQADPAPTTAKRCSSRRRLRLHLDGLGIRVTKVTLAGRRVKVTRRMAVIDLRGRPAGRVRVVISGRSRSGARRTIVRTFQTCAAT